MIRIIAGKYKNTKLLVADNVTRPTKDMVKEAIFSSIGFLNEDQAFLDVFSGSGAIGLEAISRGIGHVTLNDSDKNAYNIIIKNASKFNGSIDIYNLDYKALLNRLNKSFDYIYLDPPYIFNDFEQLITLIDENKILKNNGTIIIEVDKNTKIKESYLDYELYKSKKYGITCLYYFKRRNNE